MGKNGAGLGANMDKKRYTSEALRIAAFLAVSYSF